MDISVVWLIDIVFPCRILVCTVCQSYSFHCAESSPFCNHTICLHFYFLVKWTRHGKKIVSFYFFLFICGRAKCLLREQCVGSRVQE
jgi:hypothetical protein